MSCHLIETANAAAKAVAPGETLPDVARDALLAALDDERRGVEASPASLTSAVAGGGPLGRGRSTSATSVRAPSVRHRGQNPIHLALW